ncbi:MAG: HEAT repeat domain-containing protein [Planctomycetota bacterium]|jgi:HEAT repeat protein
MRVSRKVPPALLLPALCFVLTLSGPISATLDKADIDKKLAAIAGYERGMDREPLIAVEEIIRQSQNKPELRKYVERRLAELLAGATLEGKSFICKQLWSIGTADSVPAVAKLLADESTADMACYAIGQNPSPEAGKALRDALSKTSPQVQIRIINLLGDRRDTQSVEAIGKLVFAAEKQVGEAAVTALGKIGGAQARKILAQARARGDSDLKFAATDAYLRCAEDLAAAGETEQATAIYKELAGQNEEAIFRSAAIKGLADIGGPDAVPLVIAALRDQNRMVRTTAGGCVRTMQGQGVTELFAAELPKTPIGEQVLLISALADRGDPAALPVIIAAAKSTDAGIRKAALQAIGKLGDASSVDLLVEVAAGRAGSEEKAAAINSLGLLGGDGVDNAIVKHIQNSQPTLRAQLIQVLSDRNAVGAVAALLAEAAQPGPRVRRAAFKALGKLAGEKDLPALVETLVQTEDNSGRTDAEKAVVAVCRRITDENKRADVVLAAHKVEKRVAVRCSLLRVLGGIANGKALVTLVIASKAKDPVVSDTAVRALAKWPDATTAGILLETYSQTQNDVHRLLSLRGFVRLLALPAGSHSAHDTLEMCRLAMGLTRDLQEKKLLLSGLANLADPEALAIVEPFLQVETVRAEAATAAIRIARAIAKTHPEQARTAMNKLLAVSQSRNLREQAKEIILQIGAAGNTAVQDEKIEQQ